MMNRQAGVDYVKVSKAQLLSTLKDNRDTHRALFEEAMEGYKQQAIKTLVETLDAIRDDEPRRVVLNMPMPEDHTDDYDTVIEMLKWSLDNEVWLTDYEFKQYVLDEWGWKDSFTMVASTYTEGQQ